MKKRKIVMSVLIVTMLASCMACGNIKDHKDETLKNSVTEKVTVSDTEVAKDTENIDVATEEDTEKAIADGNTNIVTPETEKSVAENNKANAGNNSGNSGNNGNHNENSNGNNGNHNGNNGSNNGNHNDNNKPTDPTCTTDGVITKKCSCGDVITEPNGKALGHNMVHHDAVTHTEQKLVKDAYDEPIYKNGYQCNACSKFFEDDGDAILHVCVGACKGKTYSTAHNVIVGYTHHDAVYETVTITDVEAYDECSRCNAR